MAAARTTGLGPLSPCCSSRGGGSRGPWACLGGPRSRRRRCCRSKGVRLCRSPGPALGPTKTSGALENISSADSGRTPPRAAEGTSRRTALRWAGMGATDLQRQADRPHLHHPDRRPRSSPSDHQGDQQRRRCAGIDPKKLGHAGRRLLIVTALYADAGESIEEIARFVGHSSSHRYYHLTSPALPLFIDFSFFFFSSFFFFFRSVADGSDGHAYVVRAMSEHGGASWMPDGLQPEQANLQVEQARMMLGVRIGVCSDVHGRHDRLLAVLGAMAAAGVDERWCLGDLVGGEPVTAELVGAARQLDLLIAGNHDAWALGPDRVVARGRDVFRLSSRARPAVTASTAGTARRATPCSGSSPRRLPPNPARPPRGLARPRRPYA